MAKLRFDVAGRAQQHEQLQHAKQGANSHRRQNRENGVSKPQHMLKRPAAGQPAQGAEAKRFKAHDNRRGIASGAQHQQDKQSVGRRQKGADADDEHYRRAMARIEMGPDDDGDMSDLSDLDESEQDADEQPDQQIAARAGVQHQRSQQFARPGSQPRSSAGKGGSQQQQRQPAPAQGNGYLLPQQRGAVQGETSDAQEEGSDDSMGSDVSNDGDGGLSESDDGGHDEHDSEDASEGLDSEEEAALEQPTLSKTAALATQQPQLARDNEDSETAATGSDDDDGSDDDGGGSEGSEDEDDDEAKEALQQLAELPLGQRLALLQDGSGPKGQVARAAAQAAKIQEQSFKRLNKHRPQEMSSKRPVPRFKQVIEPTKKPAADPRFSRAASDKEKEIAARRYAFLYDDVMSREKNELKTRIKEERNTNARTALSRQLQRLEQTLAREKQRRTHAELEHQVRAQQRTAVESGHKPFFLKNSDKKKLALVAKYQELKQKGQLDRYMEKRRKHNASKDHRYIPAGRRADQQ